jgi:hypothetical protein
MLKTSVPPTLLIIVAVVTAACSRPTYVPDITLTQPGPIIDATAEFHDLYPAPALASGKETFGLEAPKAKRMEPRELVSQVEAELLKEFESSGTFTRVTRFDPHPDVILSGRINALYEHYRPLLWTYVPAIDTVTKVLRLKSHISSGEADLTIFALKPDGELLGTYRGKAAFRETFNPTKDVPPGARLNRALSDAVQQIQEKIVRDAQLRKVASR